MKCKYFLIVKNKMESCNCHNIMSNYYFFNSIPIKTSYLMMPNVFSEKNFKNIFSNLSKNAIVYSKDFKHNFECNFSIISEAFPSYSIYDIMKIFSKNSSENICNELLKRHPSLSTIYNLIKKREDIEFEKLSFETATMKNFYLFQYLNDDRSLKRRKEVIKKYNEISFQIHECFEKMNKTILYIPIIDSFNIDNIQKFLNNSNNIINKIKSPKPILSNFCLKINSKDFTFNLIDKITKTSFTANFFWCSFFSKRVQNSIEDFIDIEVNDVHCVRRMLSYFYDNNDVKYLDYSDYPTLKNMAEKFDSEILRESIRCFESNIENLKKAFEQCFQLIELQENLFNVNEIQAILKPYINFDH